MTTIHKHVLKVSRTSIQAGIPNNDYPIEHLTDYRLVNHIPQHAMLKLKGFTRAPRDAHFHDAVCGDQKAEGKCINQKGVNFNPSRNTGAERHFVQEHLDRCFDLNNFYFLYEIAGFDDTYLTFNIYWVPIETIRAWYATCGNLGKITLPRFRNCLSQVSLEQTSETRD
jgi:hypothetical protein